jgi:hypothetical protein
VITAETILANHDRLQTGKPRAFAGLTLAYVTPVSRTRAHSYDHHVQWHSHGYDIAKWQAHKIDLLAPVWFQIVPSPVTTGEDAPILCSIEGVHDMDQGAAATCTRLPARTAWLNDVRANNSHIRVVPRFLFDKFQPIQINRLLTNVIEREECVRTVRNFVLVSVRRRMRACTHVCVAQQVRRRRHRSVDECDGRVAGRRCRVGTYAKHTTRTRAQLAHHGDYGLWRAVSRQGTTRHLADTAVARRRVSGACTCARTHTHAQWLARDACIHT